MDPMPGSPTRSHVLPETPTGNATRSVSRDSEHLAAVEEGVATKGLSRSLSIVGEGLHILYEEYNESPIIHAFLRFGAMPRMEDLVAIVEAMARTSPRFTDTIARDPTRCHRGYAWAPCPSDEPIASKVLRFARVTADGTVYEEDEPAVAGDHVDPDHVDPAAAEAHKRHFVGSVLSRPFRAGYPLWEMWLMSYDADPSRHELVVRIAHSIGDGITLATVLMALGERASPKDRPDSPGKQHEERPAEPKASALTRCCACIGGMLFTLYVYSAALLKVLALTFYPNDFRSAIRPKGVFEVTAAARQRCAEMAREVAPRGQPFLAGPAAGPAPFAFAEKSVPLQLIKEICRGAGALNGVRYTVNDVIQAAHYSAMRRYNEKNSPKQGCWKKTSGIVVLNTRAVKGLQEAGFHDDARWGNDIGYIFIDYPQGKVPERKSPLDLLHSAHRDMVFFKTSPEPFLIFHLNKFLRKVLPTDAFMALNRFLLRKTSFSLSNLRGPLVPLKWAGQDLVHVSNCFAPLMHSCQHSFMSYNDTVTYCTAVARDIIEEPQEIVDLFEEEIMKMAQAAGNSRIA